jgi:hypothetical protein
MAKGGGFTRQPCAPPALRPPAIPPAVTTKEGRLALVCLQAWRSSFVVLDSEHAALVTVDPSSGAVRRLWAVRFRVMGWAVLGWEPE